MECGELIVGREGDITHGHAKQSRDVMLQLEILVGKGLGAVDTGATCTVAIKEISPLYHEVFDLIAKSANKPNLTDPRGMKRGFKTDDSMKLAAFIALRIALRVLSLASAVLAEVFCGFRCGVCE